MCPHVAQRRREVLWLEMALQLVCSRSMNDSALPKPEERAALPAPRSTIRDVAQQAGVSVSAVSKVLRDAYGVSAGMRQRVLAAVEELNYRPHTGARAMRGKTYTLGVVLVDYLSQFQPEVVQAITSHVQDGPYQEIIIPAGRDSQRQQDAVEAMLDRNVDGLILIAPQTPTEWLEELGRRVPLVVVARHGEGDSFDTVVDNDYFGAELVVDHLVSLGHERIVHTSHPSEGLQAPHVLSQTARRIGYLGAMQHHGLSPWVEETSFTEDGGYSAAQAFLSSEEKPTAVFAGADIAALGVLRALEERGLNVPGDISLCGYDNTYISGVGRVSLSTVDQSAAETGAASAALLLERIHGRTESAHRVIQPRLCLRSTIGQVPTNQRS